MKLEISSVLISALLHSVHGGNLRGKEHELSNRDLQQRIVGGTQSAVGEFPYYVDMGGCGGSLIAPGVVLSAAHCGSYSGQRVIVGGYEFGQLTGGATRVRVVESKIHPNYNTNTVANDFMLHRLETPVNQNTNVVLSINDEYAQPSAGQDLTVLGLGATVEGGGVADILRDVIVKAIDTDVCNASDAYDGEIQDNIMFCAGVTGGGKDSCQGDSGGPIVIRNGDEHIQVGVVSWGNGCARPDFPGIYARVSSANGWIKNVVCDDWQLPASFCAPAGPTNPPTLPPTPVPFSCSGDEVAFDWTLRTDDWAEETSWKVTNSQGVTVLENSSLENDRSYNTQECLANGCYTLTLSDTYGDGLSVGGSDAGYSLVINGAVVQQGGADNFGFEFVSEFGNCDGPSPTTPPPTDPPQATPPPTDPPQATPPPTDPPQATPPPTEAPAGCTGNDIEFDFTLTTDDWGEETTWSVRGSSGNEILSGGPYENDQPYNTKECISGGCYTLTIFDSYGDGLSVGGAAAGYRLLVDASVAQEGGNEDWGYEISFSFGDCDSNPTDPPVDQPTDRPQSTPPPTDAPAGCSQNQIDFDFTLRTDDWASETSWKLTNEQGVVVLSVDSHDNDDVYITKQCIAAGCYTLTIADTYGDGLSVGGTNPGYVLTIDGQIVEEANSENFGFEKVLQFGTCQENPSCSNLTFRLRTDDWGYESSFTLISDGDVVLDESGFDSNQNYEYTKCLDPSFCHELTVYDSYGDGLSSPGKIQVLLDGDLTYEVSDFNLGIMFEFGAC